jgi:hypothetical protein
MHAKILLRRGELLQLLGCQPGFLSPRREREKAGEKEKSDYHTM